MPTFSGLLIVSAVAFGAPFVLGLFGGLRIPAVVLEIVAGIVVGPSVLGWVEVDGTIAAMAKLGLAFLPFLLGLGVGVGVDGPMAALAPLELACRLFLGGLAVHVGRLRGRLLGITAGGYAASLVI